MEINRFQVYEHDDYGDVLAMGVHRVFDKFDTETKEGKEGDLLVVFSTAWGTDDTVSDNLVKQPVDEFEDTATPEQVSEEDKNA